MAATPDLLSFAPSVQSEKCSRTPVTPSMTSGSAARMPMTHMKRRKLPGRKPSTWKSVQAATTATQYLLTFHASGTKRAAGEDARTFSCGES